MAKMKMNVENARIGFRDFLGKVGPYNKMGAKSFAWFIEDEELAVRLKEDGWNVKRTKVREDGEGGYPYINVAVRFDNFPPTIVLINGPTKTILNENRVAILDGADIENVDMVISGSRYEVNGASGIKAYLNKMYVTIEPDPFEEKYYGNESENDDMPF